MTVEKGVDESNSPTRCAGAITLIKLPAFSPTRQYGGTPKEVWAISSKSQLISQLGVGDQVPVTVQSSASEGNTADTSGRVHLVCQSGICQPVHQLCHPTSFISDAYAGTSCVSLPVLKLLSGLTSSTRNCIWSHFKCLNFYLRKKL